MFYNDTTEQVFTLATEEAQTNVFLKYECTIKSAFQRKAEMFGLYCFCEIRISVLRRIKKVKLTQ